jgi:hypothetical protein
LTPKDTNKDKEAKPKCASKFLPYFRKGLHERYDIFREAGKCPVPKFEDFGMDFEAEFQQDYENDMLDAFTAQFYDDAEYVFFFPVS